MAWDDATADNVSRRSAAQSDVAPRSVNRRVLRSDDSLFTYDDDTVVLVGDRYYSGVYTTPSGDLRLVPEDGSAVSVESGGGGITIDEAVTIKYNSSDDTIDFVFL